MIQPPRIERRRVQDDPDLIWNTFTDFISCADTREMDDIQMAAQLTYWYDHQVAGEGHLHYFEEGYLRLEIRLNVLIMASLDALKIIRADRQAEILAEASDLYFSRPRQHCRDHQELKYLVGRNEFSRLDNEYRKASPDIPSLLKKYLMNHLDHFVELV